MGLGVGKQKNILGFVDKCHGATFVRHIVVKSVRLAGVRLTVQWVRNMFFKGFYIWFFSS